MQKIAKALATFHGLMQPVSKDKTNPHFRNKYASLDSILEAIREPLKASNLIFLQLPTEGGKLKTILIETESGEMIESTMDILLAKNDPQGQGSALTYARRYALSAILGLSTDEDDDGHAGTHPKPVAKPATPTTSSKKSQIVKLMSQCGLQPTTPTAEAWNLAVQSALNLELVEANYDAIISMLEKQLTPPNESNA